MKFYSYKGKRLTLDRICEDEKIQKRHFIKFIEKGLNTYQSIQMAKKYIKKQKKCKVFIDGMTVKEYCKKYGITKSIAYTLPRD